MLSVKQNTAAYHIYFSGRQILHGIFASMGPKSNFPFLMAIITSHTNDNQIIYNESLVTVTVTDQKIAIVTGASSSVRRATAVALAKERVKVTVAARRQILNFINSVATIATIHPLDESY